MRIFSKALGYPFYFFCIFLYLEKIKQYFALICFNSFYFTLNVYVIKGFTSNFNHISSHSYHISSYLSYFFKFI